jgi:hypothetical protein
MERANRRSLSTIPNQAANVFDRPPPIDPISTASDNAVQAPTSPWIVMQLIVGVSESFRDHRHCGVKLKTKFRINLPLHARAAMNKVFGPGPGGR